MNFYGNIFKSLNKNFFSEIFFKDNKNNININDKNQKVQIETDSPYLNIFQFNKNIIFQHLKYFSDMIKSIIKNFNNKDVDVSPEQQDIGFIINKADKKGHINELEEKILVPITIGPSISNNLISTSKRMEDFYPSSNNQTIQEMSNNTLANLNPSLEDTLKNSTLKQYENNKQIFYNFNFSYTELKPEEYPNQLCDKCGILQVSFNDTHDYNNKGGK